ncbi:MAG: Mlc titration factor MtfA (ptsG expression regulator) [Nonlabens sp.]|jgi:Mlc titration factor MtfA (ptsG expression regulator)|uniref:M90 family metallopeptidase n=1 Tax=Nonlabens sp. TaxID=1888209 RepID=UPI0039E33B5D
MIYLIIPLIAACILYFLLFHNSRPHPITDQASWHEPLLKQVSFYQKLNEKEQQIFRQRMAAFLEETYVDSVGFELEELDEILVAASAVIPVFKFKEWRYNNLTGVVIYPDNFNENLGYKNKDPNRMIGGLEGTGRFEKQMILSRKALHHGIKNDTDQLNRGIHEFVHLLDKIDGAVDGLPDALLDNSCIIPWLHVMPQEMEAIRRDESDIRSYAATNQAEFFAVSSEYFFSRPQLMRRKHPEIYKMLNLCFNP